MRAISISATAISLVLFATLNVYAAPVDGPTVKQPAAPAGVQDVEQQAMHRGRPRIALSLGGGGGRGAAHVGVLKVLEEAGIKPDFVAGSSIGAVIGSLYCAGVPVSRIEELTLNGELRKGLMPSGLKWQAAKSIPRYVLLRTLQLHPAIGLYSGKSIQKFIERNVPPDERNIENLRIPFAAIATNIVDTRPVWISKGSVAEAVRASASIPFVYQTAKVNGKILMDGGIRENLPTEPALATGAPLIIAVKLNSSLDAQPEKRFRNFLDYSDRILSILMAEIESKTSSEADVLIEPNIADTSTYSFKSEELRKAMLAGEEAARKMLPEIQRKMLRTYGTATSGESTE